MGTDLQPLERTPPWPQIIPMLRHRHTRSPSSRSIAVRRALTDPIAPSGAPIHVIARQLTPAHTARSSCRPSTSTSIRHRHHRSSTTLPSASRSPAWRRRADFLAAKGWPCALVPSIRPCVLQRYVPRSVPRVTLSLTRSATRSVTSSVTRSVTRSVPGGRPLGWIEGRGWGASRHTSRELRPTRRFPRLDTQGSS